MNPDLVYPLDGWKAPEENDLTTLPESGIAISRPSQGVLCTQVAMLGAGGGGWLAVNVYEDIGGFLERFQAWRESGKPFLEYIEPLYGFHGYLPREAVGSIVFIASGYEDRASLVKVKNEMVRQAERQRAEAALRGLGIVGRD